MVALSIIIPIYNVENYVARAIDSALSQKMDSYEVILVDDGSTDGCYDICESYRNDEKIKIIHKTNGGLVDARKVGVEHAVGKYITFLDGDDWVEESYYSNMVRSEYFGKADIICSAYISDYGDARKDEIHENFIKTGVYEEPEIKKIKSQVLYSGRYYEYGIIPTVWSKLFKKDILEKWIFRIPNGITVGEDVACTMPVLLDSKCVEVNNFNHGYHYRCTGSSMSRSFPQKRITEVKNMLNYLYSAISSFGRNYDTERTFYTYSSFLLKHVIKGTAVNCDTATLGRLMDDTLVKKCVKESSEEKLIPFRYRIMYIMMEKKLYRTTLFYYRLTTRFR